MRAILSRPRNLVEFSYHWSDGKAEWDGMVQPAMLLYLLEQY